MKKNLFFACCLVILGCKSPFERTRDASGGGPTGTFLPTTAFVIFGDELQSGGGAFEFPGSENQSLSFNDTSNALGFRSIRYSWTGGPVSNTGCPAQNPTHNFAGFDLMFTPTQDQYKATPIGRDLRPAGYSKVTFFARGSLSTNTYAKVEVATAGSSDACAAVVAPCIKLISGIADPAPAQDATCSIMSISSQWVKYTIPVSNASLANVRDFFKSTFVFVDPFVGNLAPGQGGTVFYDNIQYE